MECFLLKGITKVVTVSVLIILVGSLHVFLGNYFGRDSEQIAQDPQVSVIRDLVGSQTRFLRNVGIIMDVYNRVGV